MQNCNSITDRQVKVALEAGIDNWRDVHAHFGSKPNCGQCQCEIVNILEMNRLEQPNTVGVFDSPSLVSVE